MPKLLSARPPKNKAEEQQVQQLAASRHAPGDWIQRARMIVRSWAGHRTGAIARELHCHPQTVRERPARFNTEGLADRPGAGRQPPVSEAQRSALIALAGTAPPGRLVRREGGSRAAAGPRSVSHLLPVLAYARLRPPAATDATAAPINALLPDVWATGARAPTGPVPGLLYVLVPDRPRAPARAVAAPVWRLVRTKTARARRTPLRAAEGATGPALTPCGATLSQHVRLWHRWGGVGVAVPTGGAPAVCPKLARQISYSRISTMQSPLSSAALPQFIRLKLCLPGALGLVDVGVSVEDGRQDHPR
jgi:hypothetical protein